MLVRNRYSGRDGNTRLCRGAAPHALLGGQLQHVGSLALAKPGQEHDRAICELDRVVVGAWQIAVDLPEATDLSEPADADLRKRPSEGVAVLRVLLEGDLGPRHQADRDVRLVNCGEAAAPVIETRRHERVRDPGRSRGHSVQTVIAHEVLP